MNVPKDATDNTVNGTFPFNYLKTSLRLSDGFSIVTRKQRNINTFPKNLLEHQFFPCQVVHTDPQLVRGAWLRETEDHLTTL